MALFFATVAFAWSTAPSAQQSSGLFVEAVGPAAAAADQRTAADRTRIRSRTVRVDFPQLGARDSLPDAGTTLQLNLFDDASYRAVLDRIDPTQRGFVWVGHIAGVEMSTVSLATEDGVMSGMIQTPEATYTIGFAGGGLHSIVQIDQSAFPQGAEPREVPAPPASADVVAPPQADTASFIDVMVLYTPAAANSVGGTSAINAMIANEISLTNTSYANSDVTQRLRLVHSAPISYSESGSFNTDLDNLTFGVGALSGVAALRNTYQADVVTLMNYTPATSVCGIAWIMTSPSSTFSERAYNVVDTRCAISILGYSHELGHNMGLRHDWYLDNGTTPYSYAHGYVNAGTSASTRWRTPMAYSGKCSDLGISCPVIPYWSNPLLTYNGAPLGVAGGTSTACTPGNLNNPLCDADEHRALNNTAFTIANFRQSNVPVSVNSLTPNVSLPVTVGTPITWTATASGGTPPLQYQFWRFTDGVGWTVAQAYGSSNSYTWFPVAGTHALQVWVRSSGSSNTYDAWLGTGNFTVLAPTARLTSFSSDVAFPAPFNVPITFTASATAGSTPVEYKFWRYTSTTGWTVARDYSSANTFTWYPPAGSNAVQVWVRAVGYTASYQDWMSTDMFDVVVPSPRLATIQANVAFPAAPTTSITWTATASGGTGPLDTSSIATTSLSAG